MKGYYVIILLCVLLTCNAKEEKVKINTDFPGGNIIVDKISVDTVYLRPDNRDSSKPWFYWYFEVVSNRKQRVVFKFNQEDVMTTFGPGVSLDTGRTWHWLFNSPSDQNYFEYSFPEGSHITRFSMGMPYMQSDLERFCQKFNDVERFRKEVLCKTVNEREIELIAIFPIKKDAAYKVLITARHHASEMMANYIMEGIIEGVMNDKDTEFLQEHVEFMFVPFMDKDGVEQGDQGKHRAPRDHNRDYIGESIYISTKTLRNEIPKWSDGKLKVAIDLHCPWIKYDLNETIYMVGSSNEKIAQEQILFSKILDTLQHGSLTFRCENFLPYGKAWNTDANYDQGRSFDKWASQLPGILLSSTIETPYSNNEGIQVTQESAREFGSDIARALNIYLEQKHN